MLIHIPSHEIIIVTYKKNQNRIWNLIFNKFNFERWNWKEKKKDIIQSIFFFFFFVEWEAPPLSTDLD
jgi:hypothetical protein